MLKASKEQKQRIAILTKDKELKRLLVQEATGDFSKTSTNDLTHAEANTIIVKFGQKPLVYENWAFFDIKKTSHRQILSLCIQYGWAIPNNKHGQIADIGKLSEWLKSPKSPVKKKLLIMSPTEVSRIIVALENMVAGRY